METIETTIYKCDHCGKPYRRKFYCIKHEPDCRKNPVNDRPCFHCECLTMKKIEYGDYDPEGNFGAPTANALYCRKQGIFVYPPYVKKPYLEEEDPDLNMPMPITCELQKEA